MQIQFLLKFTIQNLTLWLYVSVSPLRIAFTSSQVYVTAVQCRRQSKRSEGAPAEIGEH